MSTGNNILETWPAASVFEQRLANMGVAIIKGGEIDRALKRYSAARSALARERLAVAAKAMGYALAAVAEDEPAAAEAAKVARESYELLQALVG